MGNPLLSWGVGAVFGLSYPWSPHEAAVRINAVDMGSLRVFCVCFSHSNAPSEMVLILQQLKTCPEALALVMYPFNF